MFNFKRKRGLYSSKTRSSRFHWKPALESLELRRLPAIVTWIGGSGNWNVPTNWDTGTLPGPNDDAIIDKSGSTVTHSTGTHNIASLTTNNGVFSLTGGTLTIQAALQGNSTISMVGGTLANATVAPGTALRGPYGTLKNLTMDGTIDLGTLNGDFDIEDGLTLNGLALLGNASGTTIGLATVTDLSLTKVS